MKTSPAAFRPWSITPGQDSRDDSLFINMGAVDRNFFTPEKMVQAGH